MYAFGDLAREFGIFGLLYAPTTALTLFTTDFEELTSSPWFVAVKVIVVNVLLPTGFAVWRVMRKRRADSDAHRLAERQAVALARVSALLERLDLGEAERVEARAIFLNLETDLDEQESPRR